MSTAVQNPVKTTTTTKAASDHSHSADPLPYIIVFAILFVGALAALTWMLGVWFKEHQCALNPNIWCSDTWQCNNNCPTGFTGSACFLHGTGTTGLASCLFGPTAAGANICIPAGVPTGGIPENCNCPAGITGATNNCLGSCPQNLSGVANGNICCCKPDTGGCPYTSSNPPPAECGQFT